MNEAPNDRREVSATLLNNALDPRSESAILTRAAPADLEPILAFLTSANLPTIGVAENLQGFTVLREGDSIVGIICLEDYGSDVLLRSLAVDAKLRSRGLGSRLVRTFLDQARSLDKKRIYLLTDTASTFFERFGFQYVTHEEIPARVKTTQEFSLPRAIGADAMILDLTVVPSSSDRDRRDKIARPAGAR